MAGLFADIKTPYVNQVTLKRIMAPKVKENIFQNILTRPDEAVTEKFSTDTDAAEIQVIRVKCNDKQAREIGADVNGGYFNSEAATQPATEAYGIRILTTIDYNIDIPTNMQDMVNVDMAEAELKNLSGKVARNVNALTIASQLAKNFNDKVSVSGFDNWVKIDAAAATKGKWTGAIIEAGSILDSGNTGQDIDAYPDSRSVLLRPTSKKDLLKDGELLIGGSNYAQDILRKGGLDSDTRPNTVTGYFGEIDNMPVYMASPVIWALAEKYLGLAAGGLDKVLGIVVCSIGTGRALAFNNAIKTIDSPAGNGIRIQPKYRMGAECWDAYSVVPVVDKTFVNPATDAALLAVRAPGSRA